MKHVIESQQFSRDLIDELFTLADASKMNPKDSVRGKIMASLFYEPSTRTRFSFESAMLRLGGSVIATENAKEFSSAAKGETLEDSIRVIGSYADVIVLRHPEEGASVRASEVSRVPIINAGDGAGQHPTQALLDLYTIHKELGGIDGITIAMVGDLKHGRTVRSLAYLLGKYQNIHVAFVSPTGLHICDDIKAYLERHSVSYNETERLEDILGTADVVYQTRIQKERFSDQTEYVKYQGCYKITAEIVGSMKKDAILMHPLPRVDEISPEVDHLPQAVYFKQAEYGVLVRMALLQYLFS